jgi:FkbM family methyltransferase
MKALKLFLFRLFAGLYKKRLFRHSVQEPEMRMLTKLLASRSLHFIDVGANKGEFVHTAAGVLPPSRIRAIEPLPYFAKKLRALFPGVKVFNCVLSDHEGYTQFYLPLHNGVPDDSLASVNPPAGECEIFDVAVRTLDALTGEQALAQKCFLKIDVEGHEFAVLKGGMNFIASWAEGMLIEIEERHHAGRRLAELIAPVCEMGFACYYLDPQTSQLLPFTGETAGFQDERDLNTPRYINNFWFFAKHLDVPAVVGTLNKNSA